MSAAEFQEWVLFYSLHPFDDEHRYHRPAALISQSMAGGKMEEKLKWLKGAAESGIDADLDDQPVPGRYSEADLRTFAALGMPMKG